MLKLKEIKKFFTSISGLVIVVLVLLFSARLLSNRQFVYDAYKSYGIASDTIVDYAGSSGLSPEDIKELENEDKVIGDILYTSGLGVTEDMSVRFARNVEFEESLDSFEENEEEFFADYEDSMIDSLPINMFKDEYENQKRINSDTIGWIQIPGSEIDYPIMYRNDNNYYLNHTASGEENKAGAVFMDELLGGRFGKVTLIHGHNLKNKQAFGTLVEFKNQKYFDEHQIMYIYDGNKIREYRVFSAFIVDPKVQQVNIYFYNKIGYSEYFKKLFEQSLVSGGKLDSNASEIVILNTCSYEYQSQGRQTRTLVCWQRVR